MKAAVYYSPQRLQVEDLPTPEPGPNEILIKVQYSAICGTDVHAFLYDIAPSGSVLGHEFSGVVSGIGSDVTRWEIGDRVTCGGGTPPPGLEAPLRRQEQFNYRLEGFTNTRTRGYAEYTILNDWEPMQVPEAVGDLEASLIEPCSVAVRAVRLSNQKLGDTVAILGAGPIGLLCMQAARAAGAGMVIVSEPVPARREAAKLLGADAVVDPLSDSGVEDIMDLTDGAGPHIVYECAASRTTLDTAFNIVRKKGNVMLVALAWEQVPVLPVDWAAKEIQLNTTFGGVPFDWQVAMNLIRSGSISLEPLLAETDILVIDDIQAAFEALVRPSTQVQMVIKF